MNWGWGSSYNNEWYSLTGDWILTTYNFTESRAMIHDFKIIDN